MLWYLMDAPKLTVKRARTFRKALTPPEAKLWTALRGAALAGLKFRRQHPIGPYILDFYCDSAKLAVEIDGEGHALGDQPEHDARREVWLEGLGIATLRIPASEVRANPDGVIEAILIAARQS